MITTGNTTELIRGAAELEETERGLRIHRLPGWVRRQYPDGQLLSMETQTSGVRLEMVTEAKTIELTLHPSRIAFRGADRPRGAVDVLVDGQLFCRDTLDGGDVVEVDFVSGDSNFLPGPPHRTAVTGLPTGEHRVEIWLPHNESVEVVDLTADLPLRAARARRRLWVHHGSSISHGSNAAAPTEIWPVIAAQRGGVELRNLGFGGSAQVDPFMARVIRDTDADLISVKLGINVVNADAMRLRAFVPAVHGFLDTIRDGHPQTPLLLISPIFSGIHEQVPGPGAVDVSTLGTDQVRFIATGHPEEVQRGALTLEVIRRELASLVERRDDDPQLHYLDGSNLYGAADADQLPLVDGLHPGPAAHRVIGERFADRVFTVDGPFGPARS
ncbi:GDSL-type esterase/lipase family protein [Microlunatus soli]|uniref:Lysophospholipase L1 n=1 Tax=Microlunatus soli TaxID=630515 RepID=A0A1H1XB40_9ACTN|nr:GDSL-type esterase/lipase family protein [Microlunatus soli]SDT06524.1 Lysophospholipase L1 [Microlunatus soli]